MLISTWHLLDLDEREKTNKNTPDPLWGRGYFLAVHVTEFISQKKSEKEEDCCLKASVVSLGQACATALGRRTQHTALPAPTQWLRNSFIGIFLSPTIRDVH